MSESAQSASFNPVLGALAGVAPVAADDEAKGAIDFVLCPRGANLWLRSGIVELRFVRENGRASHYLSPELSPVLAAELVARMGVDRLDEPLVGVLRGEATRYRDPSTAGADLLGWIVPAAAEVVVFVRSLDDLEGPPPARPLPVPGSGPLALPAAMPPWRRPPVSYDRVFRRMPCASCGHADLAFRRTGHASHVCTRCGEDPKI